MKDVKVIRYMVYPNPDIKCYKVVKVYNNDMVSDYKKDNRTVKFTRMQSAINIAKLMNWKLIEKRDQEKRFDILGNKSN